jgi:hypothetical protein
LERVRKELSEMNQHINQVATTMSRLTDPLNPDLAKDFSNFKRRITMVEHKTGKIITKVDEMKANSVEYFSLWNKESKSKGTALNKKHAQYQQVLLEMEIAGRIFMGYLDGLYAIRDLFEGNLNALGVESAIPLIKKTSGQGKSITLQLDEISKQLRPDVNSI